jgi:hypothetical protein
MARTGTLGCTTVQYIRVQYNTSPSVYVVQYSSVLYSTIQYCIVGYEILAKAQASADGPSYQLVLLRLLQINIVTTAAGLTSCSSAMWLISKALSQNVPSWAVSFSPFAYVFFCKLLERDCVCGAITKMQTAPLGGQFMCNN